MSTKPVTSKPKQNKDSVHSILVGAAFLMATSAIGPGFLARTPLWTEQYGATFSFAIVLAVILSFGVQLNIWRIIAVSGMRGQDVANKVVPGLGYVLSFLVVFGGLAFNIGNVGGAALGLNVLFGLDLKTGAIISAAICILIFLFKEMGKTLDKFAKYLGLVMICLVLYIAIVTKPPVGAAFLHIVVPTQIPLLPILTMLGGTVGGYVSFSGAHRLLDAGMTGVENLDKVDRTAFSGVAIAGVMRFIFFLAILGVVSAGFTLDSSNPGASTFQQGAGILGYKFFGIVCWSAAVTSIVGAAYTSISFLRTLVTTVERHASKWIIGFIAVSTLLFVIVGKPVTLLLIAGALNGLILPLTLGTMLYASQREDIVGKYRHPKWLFIFGIIVTVVTLYMSFSSLKGIANLWS